MCKYITEEEEEEEDEWRGKRGCIRQCIKEEFKKNPAQYEPQYGGWCAYAMGDSGEKVSIDPETFKVLDGKLYLFYNKFFNNTLKSWNKDEAKLKKSADANWSKTFR